MEQLVLSAGKNPGFTIISNDFIDHYMCEANGEFVKIYLYLLRCTATPCDSLSYEHIADKLNLMESDVIRAIKYWEQKGLLVLHKEAAHNVTSLELTYFFNPAIPNQTEAAAQTSAAFSPQITTDAQTTTTFSPHKTADAQTFDPDSTEIQELVLIAEQYLKRQLTPIDLNKIMFFYEDLHFSSDLIEYLFEHCATINNRNIRYIESVAISWADKGITTVQQAKTEGQHYRREYFDILKAFGIHNRLPISSEVDYMKKWMDEYGFTTDIITEACQRTVAKTGNATFKYADSILKNWKENGVVMFKDIAALDTRHYSSQAAQNRTPSAKQHAVSSPRSGSKFNNFDQRGYDFEQLEKDLNLT